MGSVCFFLETFPRRNGTEGELCQIEVADVLNRIELRLGPPDGGDGPETYCVNLTLDQTRALTDALESVAGRLERISP